MGKLPEQVKAATETAKDNLPALADAADVAALQAQLFSKMQLQAQRLQLINEITQLALTSSNLNQMVTHICQRIVAFLAVAGCYVMRWDVEQDMLIPLAAAGEAAADFMRLPPAPGAPTLSQMVLHSGRALFAEDLSGMQALNPQLLHPLSSPSILALPLKVGEHHLGVLLLEFGEAHPEMTQTDISRWEEIAAQISLAIAHVASLDQEKQRRSEAEILRQAIAVINSSLNLERVLNSILEHLEEVVPFDSASIFLSEGGQLRVAALSGQTRHLKSLGENINKKAGLFALLEGAFAPVILADAQAHPLYQHWSSDGPDMIHGWMGVPLVAYEHEVGCLMLNSWDPDVYTGDHARMAQSFASQAAVAIENARLFEQVRAGRERLQGLSKKLVEVQEGERRFLAHELHDEIGQMLTGLQFTLEMGKRVGEAERVQTLNDAQELVRQLMAQVRELSLNLRPAMLDDLGLLPALKGHFQRYQELTGIQVQFEYENLEMRFPGDIEVTAFRVAQEALTNVARYAGTQTAQVRVLNNGEELLIEVIDQGRGFDTYITHNSSQAFGITGMRERAYLVGGRFEIESQPGAGTRVFAALPVGNRLERRKCERKSNPG